MEVEQLFALLRIRRKVVYACVVAMLMVAGLVRLVVPPKFSSMASVVADTRGINPVSGLSTQQPNAQDAVLGTYINIMRSEGVARQVWKETGVLDQLQKSTKVSTFGSQEDANAWAAKELLKGLDVRVGGQSSHVIDVTYTGKDRELSARLANAFANEAIRFSKEMRVGPAIENADFFRAQTAELRQKMESAEQRLASFQRISHINSSDEKIDVETARLAALTAQVVATQALGYDSTSRANQANASGESAESVSNPLIQTLRADIARLSAKIQELSPTLGLNHPQMVTMRAQIDEMQRSLAQEIKRVNGSLKVSSEVSKQKLIAQRDDTEEQRRKVQVINGLRADLAALTQDAAQARRLYETAVVRSNESNLEARSQQADLRILTTAVPAESPSGFGLTVTIPLAIFLGVVISAFLIVLSERFKPHMNGVEDLEAMGLTVLATIPVIYPRNRMLTLPRLR